MPGFLTAKYAKYAKMFCFERRLPILSRFALTVTVDSLKTTKCMDTEIIYKDGSYKIIGACFEVYREKGCGFLEQVYQECMEIELRLQGIPYVAKKPLALEYKQCPLRSTFEPDFVCHDKIVLELKAATETADEHRAQLQNYLKATGFRLGLLVNFGHYPKAQVERIAAERGRYDKRLAFEF